jgi:hypothetical protein
MDQEPKPEQNSEAESLEAPASAASETASNENSQAAPDSLESTGSEAPNTDMPPAPSPDQQEAPAAVPIEQQQVAPPPKPKGGLIGKLQSKIIALNIYFLSFALLIVIAGFITYIAYQKSQQSAGNDGSDNLTSQGISDDVLKQLKNTDVTVGQPKQILSVEANAVFAGTVLVRGDFETAGQIRSEGPITASAINSSGNGTFQTLQASKLEVSGDGQVQGNLNVQNSLSVSGSGNFGGTLSANKISIQSLELAGDLLLSKHINTSGGNPSRSNGSALGGGGTSSVSGTDTAGTISINTGNSPHAGCFITVNFTQKFNSPHVAVTPVSSAAASIDYYVNRSSGNFSLCSASGAPGGKNLRFDYIVID